MAHPGKTGLRNLRILVILCSALLTSACGRAALIAANLPERVADGQFFGDIVYDAATGQKLDVYKPEGSAKESAPVVVFFYGGRWQSGDKKDYRFVAKRFAEAGYLVVIPDYRKYPAVKFPAFVEDGAAAIEWVASNISRYAGDPRRLYLAGHSSGAHIAALLASDERYLKTRAVDPGIIRAFAGLAGPYSFVPEDADLVDMFGPPANFAQMQVTSFIDGAEPPMLLLWGEDDTVVAEYNMTKLASAAKAKGGMVKIIKYPGIDHVGIVGAFSWAGHSAVVKDVIAFFKAHP